MLSIFKKAPLPSKKTQKRSVVVNAEQEDILFNSGYTRAIDNEDVRKCIHKIADLVSDMTIMLMENTDIGDKRVRNELSKKIDIYPNKLMTKKQFYYRIVSDMAIYGNSVVYPVVKDGYIDDLQLFDMSCVSYKDTADGCYNVYYKGKNYGYEDILHFVIIPDRNKPYKGEGYTKLIQSAVENLGQAEATKTAFHRSKWKPSLVISVNSDAEELADTDGRKKLLDSYISDTEQGKPWIIPADEIKVDSIRPLSLADLGIHDSIKLEKQVIANAFGVPAFMLGVGDYNKDEYNNFITTTVYSYAQILQQELTRKLLYKPDWYFKFNPRSLMMYDLSEKTTHVTQMVDRGMLNKNEGREQFDYSPSEAEGMNDYAVLENYIPVDMIGQQGKLNAELTERAQGGIIKLRNNEQEEFEEKHPRDDKGKFKKVGDGLTKDEEGALKAYKSSESYKINEKLRNGEKLTDEEKKLCDDLDSALKKLPKYEGDLNRDLSFATEEQKQAFLDSHEVGSVVTYPAYTSTTKDDSYNDAANVRCIITNTKNGRDLKDYDNGENEVLYERNAKFNVVSKEEGDISYIYLKEAVQNE